MCFREKSAVYISVFRDIIRKTWKKGMYMVFKRKVYDKLLEWKKLSAGASAVLLEGARRIGKSTIVEEFAKNEYDDYMVLDFARENKDVRNNFIENMDDLDSFFRNLFLLKGKSLNGKNCVIIFDEAQMLPNDYLKPCIAMIEELLNNYKTSVVLCTATQPALKSFFQSEVLATELCPRMDEQFHFFKENIV